MGEKVGYRYKELSNKLYKVIVPSIATYSDEELKRSAMLPIRVYNVSDMSGEDLLGLIQRDSPLAAEVTIMIPIARMLEIFTRGYPIRVVKDEDVIDIYNNLEDYFSGSATETDQIFHAKKYYDERLPMIDRFLDAIFAYHKVDIIQSRFTTKYKGRFAADGFKSYKPLHQTNEQRRSAGTTFDGSNTQATGIMQGYNVGYSEMQKGGYQPRSVDQYRDIQPAVVEATRPIPVNTTASEIEGPGRYKDINNSARRLDRGPDLKEMKTEAKVLAGNYINMNMPELNLEKLKNIKRPDRPGIDLDMYRNK